MLKYSYVRRKCMTFHTLSGKTERRILRGLNAVVVKNTSAAGEEDAVRPLCLTKRKFHAIIYVTCPGGACYKSKRRENRE